MNVKVELEAKDALLKYYRLEIINHIGYIISAVISLVGLFNLETFIQIVKTYEISIPIIIVVSFFLLEYLFNKIRHLLNVISDINKAKHYKKLFSIERIYEKVEN